MMNKDQVELTRDEEYGFVEDPRYKQCNREAKYGIYLGIFNLIWWAVFGYGLGSKNVENYNYILGFPAWFFWSCLVGAIVIIALTFYMVNVKMKDMPLDRMTEEEAKQYVAEMKEANKS